MELLTNGFGFLVCSLLIFFHGKRLSFYGNLISIKSGLGKAWVGLILMSSVTSLPELSIGISSVTVVNSADLAVGNVLGSCIFNLAVLSLLDAVIPGQPILARVATTNVLAASLGTILFCLVGVGLFLSNEISILNWIGVTSLSFLIVYIISMRLIHSFGLKQSAVSELLEEEGVNPMKLKTVVLWYALHAIMVVVAALILPYFSERLAAATGLGESFVGTLLLATASSLPEIAVSISAARLGNFEMAVGNLFGSNIFNVMILSVSDLFYTSGSLLRNASPSHLVTVFSTIAMNSIAIVGLTMRPSKKGFHYVAWDTLLILMLYLGTMLFLFLN